MLDFLKSQYPTDWEEQDPVMLERTVERKKYVIKLDTGEEIVTEADHVKTRGGSKYYYDIDIKVGVGYGSPRLSMEKEDPHLELNTDEVAAIKNKVVSKRKYTAENVRYESRKKKERRYRMPDTIKTEKKVLGNPEVKETRQIDTE